MREFLSPAFGASVALRQSAASSPELSSPGSVRCVLSLRFASRVSVLRAPASRPSKSSAALRSGVLRPLSSVASRVSVACSSRHVPAPQGVSRAWSEASVEAPKVIVAPALNSIREAARANKVARLAERLALIAERCR